jgi:chemotaxis protein MotA
MDISTITGIIVGTVLLLLSILLDSNWGLDFERLQLFIDIPSIFIVFGGTLATMFIRFSFRDTFSIFGIMKHTLFHTPGSPAEVIKEFVQLAQIARKDGLLALERVTIEDPFMSKGINYCVDGAETEQIRAIMLQELKSMKSRHASARKLIKSIEISAPAFGMIGTLVGLVNMLANMEDPKSIGPAMAVAILTTLYGALLANLFAIPMNEKLEAHSDNEFDLKLLMVEGIVGINRGENPRMLEEALYSFLSPKERESLKASA